jgi:hypothetical protein
MRITNFGEIVDLEAGAVIVHQFTVVAPSGHRVQITTDERTVQQLIGALGAYLGGSEVKEVPRSVPSMSGDIPYEELKREVQDALEEEEMASFFGADPDPGEQIPEPVMGSVSENQEEDMAEAAPGLGTPKAVLQRTQSIVRVDKDGFALPIPSRTVSKDEMGYPIVPQGKKAPEPLDDGDDGTQI